MSDPPRYVAAPIVRKKLSDDQLYDEPDEVVNKSSIDKANLQTELVEVKAELNGLLEVVFDMFNRVKKTQDRINSLLQQSGSNIPPSKRQKLDINFPPRIKRVEVKQEIDVIDLDDEEQLQSFDETNQAGLTDDAKKTISEDPLLRKIHSLLNKIVVEIQDVDKLHIEHTESYIEGKCIVQSKWGVANLFSIEKVSSSGWMLVLKQVEVGIGVTGNDSTIVKSITFNPEQLLQNFSEEGCTIHLLETSKRPLCFKFCFVALQVAVDFLNFFSQRSVSVRHGLPPYRTVGQRRVNRATPTEQELQLNKIQEEDETPVPNLIFTIGIPGSGKSTWARQFQAQAKAQGKIVRIVCPDDIRREICGSISNQSVNPQAWAIAKQRVSEALQHGYDVILDATNTVPAGRRRFIEGLSKHELVAKIFRVDKEVAKRRIELDIANGLDRALVPADVVDRMQEQLNVSLWVLDEEGFQII